VVDVNTRPSVLIVPATGLMNAWNPTSRSSLAEVTIWLDTASDGVDAERFSLIDVGFENERTLNTIRSDSILLMLPAVSGLPATVNRTTSPVTAPLKEPLTLVIAAGIGVVPVASGEYPR